MFTEELEKKPEKLWKNGDSMVFVFWIKNRSKIRTLDYREAGQAIDKFYKNLKKK